MAEAAQRKSEPGFFGKLWNFFVSVWIFLRSFFVLIGISVTVIMVCLAVIVSRTMEDVTPKKLPANIVLTYTFKAGIEEVVRAPSLAGPFLRPQATLRELVDAFTAAEKDARVRGFVAKIEDVRFSLAQVQELRGAIARLRKAGKFAYVYADSYGEFSSGMGDYYFATAFEQIWLQPVGVVGITGLSLEVPFVKGLFDKIGVTPQFAHKGVYKSAPETFTDTDMSAPNREAAAALVSDLTRQIVEGVSESRGIPAAEVRRDIDMAPFSDADALKAKLVDRTGYYDEVMAAARKAAGLKESDKTVDLADYAEREERGFGFSSVWSELEREMEKAKPGKERESGAQKIALILGSGEIVPFGGTHAAFGEGGIAANKIVEAFRQARDDKGVAAVVFRIDSPGGSPTAAETIRRAVVETQKAGKPVIVSMGGYAASGGYWVSANADKIVAQPATVTGSIGVFGGKFVFAGLWEKLGVNWVTISEGEHAGMWSPQRLFTPEELARFDAALGNIYESFLDRVAEGRRMTREQARAVAEGRAWTGAQAKERGLVDELGGLDRAIELAKEAAKLDPALDVEVEEFPAPKSPLEMLLEVVGEEARAPRLSLREEDVYRLLSRLARESAQPRLR